MCFPDNALILWDWFCASRETRASRSAVLQVFTQGRDELWCLDFITNRKLHRAEPLVREFVGLTCFMCDYIRTCAMSWP